jgi:chromosomal replication initiator protein
MYLCRDCINDISLKNIAEFLGKKDHTTIIHGINKVEAELSTNEEFSNKLEIIKKKLNPS